MSGFEQVKERMDNILLQKPVFIEFYLWDRFLQRNQKEVKRFFCKTRIGPGSEQTWNFAKYPDDPKGKWDELAKQVVDVYLAV